MTLDVGGFFGDEDKGKIMSYFTIKDEPKNTVHGGAGPNAGHTIRWCLAPNSSTVQILMNLIVWKSPLQ